MASNGQNFLSFLVEISSWLQHTEFFCPKWPLSFFGGCDFLSFLGPEFFLTGKKRAWFSLSDYTIFFVLQLTMAENHVAPLSGPEKEVKMLERSIQSSRHCFIQNFRDTGKMSEAGFKVKISLLYVRLYTGSLFFINSRVFN